MVWQCMDTLRDKILLNQIWKSKKIPWIKKSLNFYKNKKIIVTGATGFKGAWLCLWLKILGAKVYGIGFSPNRNKSFFIV